ncbi:pirin family protein [Siculibacillus lacustris]|uniref:Pirin family protein n=2 Tax=Siculibacillus lacustris TaxID=1549641 RepID=A0A4Q9VG68_9HYPH|nr:pirin family protein [Siculibacillus lacustris]
MFGDLAFTAALSPFLMFDWAAPTPFAPSPVPRGVGAHPHRGFETVTLVYDGVVEHRDSAGHAGAIGPGDVQWMTAGSGVLHEEKHGRAFAARGGTASMAQLWVNLPAAAKMTAPRYQAIVAAEIPTVTTAGGRVRVVAGTLTDPAGTVHVGPAATVTPLSVWDGTLGADEVFAAPVAAGWTTLVAVLDGAVRVGGSRVAGGTVALLASDGDGVAIAAEGEDARFLVLAGEPIAEPIAHYGPFVMNTREELWMAMDDFQSGRMGVLEDV